MANYCTECGSMIPQDSKFCPGFAENRSLPPTHVRQRSRSRPPKYAPRRSSTRNRQTAKRAGKLTAPHDSRDTAPHARLCECADRI